MAEAALPTRPEAASGLAAAPARAGLAPGSVLCLSPRRGDLTARLGWPLLRALRPLLPLAAPPPLSAVPLGLGAWAREVAPGASAAPCGGLATSAPLLPPNSRVLLSPRPGVHSLLRA